jgi:hypothetical protein
LGFHEAVRTKKKAFFERSLHHMQKCGGEISNSTARVLQHETAKQSRSISKLLLIGVTKGASNKAHPSIRSDPSLFMFPGSINLKESRGRAQCNLSYVCSPFCGGGRVSLNSKWQVGAIAQVG